MTEYMTNRINKPIKRMGGIMLSNAGGTKKPIANSFPESWILKSDKQKQLENNGCVFRGQEYLDNHEINKEKDCYCGRPNRKYK